MDIIYVVGQFPKLSESFVINELYELDNRGHNVSIFSINRPTDEVTHEEVQEMDLSVHYAEEPTFSSLPELLSHRVLNPDVLRQAAFIDGPLFHAFCLHLGKQISEAIDSEGGVDSIHTHFAGQNRVAVAYAAAYHGIPCTVTAHANEIFSAPHIPRLQRVCSRFDHIIVPSKYNKRYLRDEIDVETDISVVPATTDVSKFKPSDEHIPGQLLSVARLVEKKGYKYAIDAVAELVDRGYDIEYHIVGTGEQAENLRKRVAERGIEDHVEFLKNVSDERLVQEFQEAALFVLPCVITESGDRDITPVALREAMATQTPCVSTTISAIPEVITDGHDGILVEPNDSKAVAEAIADLIDNPSRRNKIAENARETIETEFDIRIAVDKLESVFHQVAD
jgi:glycosyltransferase involved in cell wall biosynthesis